MGKDSTKRVLVLHRTMGDRLEEALYRAEDIPNFPLRFEPVSQKGQDIMDSIESVAEGETEIDLVVLAKEGRHLTGYEGYGALVEHGWNGKLPPVVLVTGEDTSYEEIGVRYTRKSIVKINRRTKRPIKVPDGAEVNGIYSQVFKPDLHMLQHVYAIVAQGRHNAYDFLELLRRVLQHGFLGDGLLHRAKVAQDSFSSVSKTPFWRSVDKGKGYVSYRRQLRKASDPSAISRHFRYNPEVRPYVTGKA